MNLLLDTHALLWALGDVAELSPAAREAIEDGTNEVFVSAASAWEMAIKASLGKLDMPDDLPQQLIAAQFRQLPVQVDHAMAVRALPAHHRDPFDRLLIAQAIHGGLTLVTRDQAMEMYDVDVMTC